MIDLDAPPVERWKALSASYKTEVRKELIQLFLIQFIAPRFARLHESIHRRSITRT